MLEAAACGLPVCATNWSAHTEFLNLGGWKKIKGRIETIPAKKVDNQIFVSGAKWANPDIDFARETLKEFVLEPKDSTISLQEAIRNRYSFEKISEKYSKFWRRWK